MVESTGGVLGYQEVYLTLSASTLRQVSMDILNRSAHTIRLKWKTNKTCKIYCMYWYYIGSYSANYYRRNMQT